MVFKVCRIVETDVCVFAFEYAAAGDPCLWDLPLGKLSSCFSPSRPLASALELESRRVSSDCTETSERYGNL